MPFVGKIFFIFPNAFKHFSTYLLSNIWLLEICEDAI
jgi:hypothetical protein